METTECLRVQVERGLCRLEGAGVRVERLDRTPSPYGTSWPLEDLTVWVEGRAPLHLLFKDLSPGAVAPAVRRVKPSFVIDPQREIETYRRLLTDPSLGSARCYVAMADQAAGRYWLVLEKAPGVEALVQAW